MRPVRRKILLLASIFVGVIIVLVGILARRETWGPDVLGDPFYRSGRASLCKAPALLREPWPYRIDDLGVRSRDRGVEHPRVHTFDTTGLVGGEVSICSEYGSIQLVGVDSTQGRLKVTVADPFPGGDRAVNDTQVATEVRAENERLQVAVWQLTEGVTAFRSLFARGGRPAMVNVVLELPRTGTYDLRLTANHQRILVRNLEVRGFLEGYGSPGATIDAVLAGPLTLNLVGRSYRADWAGEAAVDLHGGTIATLRPVRSGSVEVNAKKNDVSLTFVGGEVGLEVTARGANGRGTIEIGQTEISGPQSDGTYARSAGYAHAAVQVQVRANSTEGDVVVRRSM